jgi:LPXTG-motif cell wall-anchored protein
MNAWITLLLDVPPEAPSLGEQLRRNPWMLILSLLALAGIVIFFILRRKRKS